MRKMLVLANGFPYGTWETYMEAEEPYYSAFDETWIASLQLRKDQATTIRSLQSKASVIPVFYRSKLFYLLNSFTVLADRNLYRELSDLSRSGRLSVSRIIDLFVFLSRAHHEARVIDRAMKGVDKKGLLLYAYRFEYQPYVALLLKKKWGQPLPVVCRAHGYDVYEDRHPSNYIPLRHLILDNVDRVYPCSRFGVRYIEERYGEVKAGIACSYLGTVDHGEHRISDGRLPLKIVSCSNVIDVKRLDRIIDVLSLINNIPIEWTHFGDGPLLDDIKKQASTKLNSNVRAFFPGNIANPELLNIYASEDFHLFLNVSSSEGLPVSIMEAMSFGIPCVATDVGGTGEIVTQDSGFLIDAGADDETIAATIRLISEMDRESYQALREHARTAWAEHFDSATNYSALIDSFVNLQ